MLDRTNVVGQQLIRVYESNAPDLVPGNSIGADWEYFRWYVRLANQVLVRLDEDRLIQFDAIPEPTKEPRIYATKWISAADYFGRMTFESDAVRDQYVRLHQFVRDGQVLEGERSKRILQGKEITEVICGDAGSPVTPNHVILVLNGTAQLYVYSAEGGNCLQFDELEVKHDWPDHTKWRRYFDQVPCDLFGRAV
jgi:hypothetical protein